MQFFTQKRERERGKFAGRAKESEDTGDPSGPAVCRLLSRAEPVADDLPGTAAMPLLLHWEGLPPAQLATFIDPDPVF